MSVSVAVCVAPFVAAGAAVANAAPSRGAPDSRVTKCTALLNGSLGSANWPQQIKRRVTVADEERIEKGLHRMCALAHQDGRLNSAGDFDNAAEFQAFTRAHPDALGGICDAVAVLSKASTPAAMVRYLRSSDYALFARRLCAYLPQYVTDEGNIRFAPMMRRHPEIIQRLCAAGFTAGAYDTDPTSFRPLTRSQFFGRSLGFCLDAFRTGVITYYGGSDFRIHKNSAYRPLLRKYFVP